MTPLAGRVVRELTLPKKQRTFDDQARVLDLFDQEMHCFEVSAISKSVNAVLDDPLASDDTDEAWNVWRDIESMMPRMFLPSPVTWLEHFIGGKRFACVLQERPDGAFSLLTVHDGADGPFSIDMCKFRARSILESGERIDVFDLVEDDGDELGSEGINYRQVLAGVDLKTATPEQRRAIVSARNAAEMRVNALAKKAERLHAKVDVLGAVHRIIGMVVLTLDLINTPGLIGLRQREVNKRLARDLHRVGRYPLLAWSEVVLKHQTRIAAPGEQLTGATYHKCLHFVRSHLRHYQDGRVVVIPAHWRGDPALGIKRTRYRLAA